jgi:hypothetical protein
VENRKLEERIKEDLKSGCGYNEDELKNFEQNKKLYEIVTKAHPTLCFKKMIVTCVEAENCGYNKIGDRYVFGALGRLIKDETCEKPCLFAMVNFLHFTYMAYDRAASGADLSDMHFEYIACMDTGCRFGGFGRALYKISFEDSTDFVG